MKYRFVSYSCVSLSRVAWTPTYVLSYIRPVEHTSLGWMNEWMAERCNQKWYMPRVHYERPLAKTPKISEQPFNGKSNIFQFAIIYVLLEKPNIQKSLVCIQE